MGYLPIIIISFLSPLSPCPSDWDWEVSKDENEKERKLSRIVKGEEKGRKAGSPLRSSHHLIGAKRRAGLQPPRGRPSPSWRSSPG